MRRREFLGVLGGATAWPLAAPAQRMPVVGFLSTASPAPFAHLLAGFHRGLQDTGFIEGRNVAMEYRWADGRYDRLPDLAADLVRRQVAVIVTSGGQKMPGCPRMAIERLAQIGRNTVYAPENSSVIFSVAR
jgi:putative ABC transport system substrate-binding protein